MAGGFRMPDRPAVGQLVAMWVVPEYRRQGVDFQALPSDPCRHEVRMARPVGRADGA